MTAKARLKRFVARADVADLVGVAAVAGLTLALIFGVCVPIAVHGRLAVARHAAVLQAKQRAATLTAGVRAATADVERAKVKWAAAPGRLRSNASLNERLAALVTIAGECGVTVRDLKPGDAVRDAKRLTVPLHVTGHGGYTDVTRLLRRLNSDMPDVLIDALRVTADGEIALDLRRVTALPDTAAVATTHD